MTKFAGKLLGVSAVLLLAIAAPAKAAIVTLSVTTDATAKTWSAFATVSSDSRGLSSFFLDVTGTGGITITGSTEKAPRIFDASLAGGSGDFKGFSVLSQNGTNGIGVASGQNLLANDLSYLLLDSAAGVGTPLLIATGTYSGTVGTLTAAVHAGGFFNVLPLNFAAGNAAVPATSVISGTANVLAVPEPASMAIAGIGLAALSARRKRLA